MRKFVNNLTGVQAYRYAKLVRSAAFYACAKALRKLYDTRETFAFPILEEFGYSGEYLEETKQLFTYYITLSVEELKG